MNTPQACILLESLSFHSRLDIFLHLTTVGKVGMIAGDLAKHFNISPNNLSFHLKTLTVAGLVYSNQEGRCVRYFANLDAMNELIDFLTKNCCSAVPDANCINRL